MTTFESYQDFLLHLYKNGGGFKQNSFRLFASSRGMLEHSKIVKNIDNAIILNKKIDGYFERGGSNDQEWINLIRSITSYYEYLVDDILLISAYEIYAKGMLLKKQYIAHEFSAENTDKGIRKDQKRAPYHVRTYRAQIKKGKKISIAEKTLPVSVLLKDKYSITIGTPPNIAKELKRINTVRRRLHFPEPAMYKIEKEFLKTVKYLCDTIPK